MRCGVADLFEHGVDIDDGEIGELLDQFITELWRRVRHANGGDETGRVVIEHAGRGDDEKIGLETFPIHFTQIADARVEATSGNVKADAIIELPAQCLGQALLDGNFGARGPGLWPPSACHDFVIALAICGGGT